MLDRYMDNLKQPNGEYRVGLRILCNEDDTVKSILKFAKSIVSASYKDNVKTIRRININTDDWMYQGYELEAIVDCIFAKREDADHFVYVLGSMPAWPEKSFAEVEVILKNMLKEEDLYEKYRTEY